MNEHKGKGHVTGYEPIDQNQDFITIQNIYNEKQGEIEKEEEAIAQIQYEIDYIDIGEGEDSERIIDNLEADIEKHRENIKDIVKDRDSAIKDVLSKNSTEKGMDVSQGHTCNEKNRWDYANPFKNPHN